MGRWVDGLTLRIGQQREWKGKNFKYDDVIWRDREIHSVVKMDDGFLGDSWVGWEGGMRDEG